MSERNMSSNTEIITVSVLPDRPVIFEFASNEAQFGRSGNDLNITLEGGPQIITEDYFVADANGNLPPLQFADSEPVAGEEFLAQINPEMDLAPAAGELRGGGLNAYSDASGDLIGGLELSGDLGSFAFSSAGGKAEVFSGGLAPNDAAPVAPGASVPPPVVNPPVINHPAAYDVRAVLYAIKPDGTPDVPAEGVTIRFAVPDGTTATPGASGNGLVESLTITGPDWQGFTYYEMKVSADGAAAIQNSNGGNVYDYITLSDGRVVQIIITQTGDYSTAVEDALHDHGQANPIPEWHVQPDDSEGAVNRVLGDGDDEVWFTEYVLTSGNHGEQVLDLGGGNNTLNMKRVFSANGEDSKIISGDGDDTFNFGFVQADGADNIVNSGTGNDQIIFNGELQATRGGDTHIEAVEGDINFKHNVKATNNENWATSQSNTVVANNINLNSTMGEGVMAYNRNSVNTLNAVNDININVAKGDGAAKGVWAQGNKGSNPANTANEETSNNLTAGNEVNINVNGTTGATGIGAEHSGQVSVSGDTINIDVVSSQGQAVGIRSDVATNRDTSVVLEGNDITVSASTNGGGGSFAMVAQHGAGNNNTAEVYTNIVAKGSSYNETDGARFGGSSVNVELNADYAMYANGGVKGGTSNNIIGSTQADTINVNGMMYAIGKGVNRVMAGDGDNAVTVDKTVWTMAGGSNIIESGSGNDTIIFNDDVTQMGVDAKLDINAGNGNNIIAFNEDLATTQQAETTVISGSGDDTVSMKTLNSTDGGNTVINTGTGDDTVNIGSNLTATAMHASDGGISNVTSNNVNVHGNVLGMNANAGSNVITGQNVNISSNIIGMQAESGGYNIIQARGSSVDTASGTISFGNHAITVVISVQAGATAMRAGDMSVNYIVGSNQGDSISIQGEIHATATGQNIISTGAGDDTITLQGKVMVGALNIDAGADHDTLVLVADSLQQFNEYYQDWLCSLNSSDWNDMSIESVNIQINDVNLDPGALGWLTDNANGVFANSGATITVSAGDGFDTLNIDGFEGNNVTLAELANIVDGFETIDMSGGTGTELTVNSLLDGLGNLATLDAGDIHVDGGSISADDLAAGKVLMVTGDAAQDKVLLGGDWNDAEVGTVTYDNVSYNVYANDAANDQYVLIQQGIIINS